MNPNFIYLSWSDRDRNQRLKFSDDDMSTVEVTSSVGPYKNNYADFILQKHKKYYWEIQIVKGNYFKIGIMKLQSIADLKGKAFSDIDSGYAFYSTGNLRNGTCTGNNSFLKPYGPGDIVKVQFDSDKRVLSFGINDGELSQAFYDVHQGRYVPAVAALIEGSKYRLTLPLLED